MARIFIEAPATRPVRHALHLVAAAAVLLAATLVIPSGASAQIAPHTSSSLLQSQQPAQQQSASADSGADAGANPITDAPPPDPLGPQLADETYHPISNAQRFQWFVVQTIGPQSLVVGVVTSAYGSTIDKPREYGPGWSGFGERYGLRLTGVATSNLMEASLGTLRQEDPRYFRMPDAPFGARVRNVIRLTFYAREPNGDYGLAFARFVAIPASNFLSNTWRPNSEAHTENALTRSAFGFGGRLASNALAEFWPDIKSHLFHRHD